MHEGSLKMGQLVRGRRASLDMTMEQLAERADVSRNTIWAIENAKYDVKMNYVFRVLTALHLHVMGYSRDDSFSQNIL